MDFAILIFNIPKRDESIHLVKNPFVSFFIYYLGQFTHSADKSSYTSDTQCFSHLSASCSPGESQTATHIYFFVFNLTVSFIRRFLLSFKAGKGIE